MRSRSRRLIPLIGGVGLYLLVLTTLPPTPHRPAERLLPIYSQPYAPTPPRNRCELALRQARGWQLCAVQRVNEDRELLEAAVPESLPGDVQEAWWRQLMARDRSGYLRRARAAAQRAAALARTPEERFHVALLLTRLKCYAGRHKEELQQAQRLIALEPEDESAVQALRRAAACNGIELLSLLRQQTGEWEQKAAHGAFTAH